MSTYKSLRVRLEELQADLMKCLTTWQGKDKTLIGKLDLGFKAAQEILKSWRPRLSDRPMLRHYNPAPGKCIPTRGGDHYRTCGRFTIEKGELVEARIKQKTDLRKLGFSVDHIKIRGNKVIVKTTGKDSHN